MREKRCLFPILFVIVLALSLSQFTMKRVVASSSLSASVDTYVCNKYSGDAWLNAHPWTHPYVIVGTDEPNNWLWRAFIKFDLGSLGIPTGSTIEKGEITKICQILRLAVENGSEISHKMRERNGQEDSVETHST